MYTPQIHHSKELNYTDQGSVATRSDQKTQIIKELERDIFELKHSHRDQIGLRNMIKESDLKIRQTNIVKKQRQVEFRLHLDQDADDIAQLTRERSDLKYALADHEQKDDDLKAELKNLLRILEEKTLTIKKSEHESVQSEHAFDVA